MIHEAEMLSSGAGAGVSFLTTGAGCVGAGWVGTGVGLVTTTGAGCCVDPAVLAGSSLGGTGRVGVFPDGAAVVVFFGAGLATIRP